MSSPWIGLSASRVPPVAGAPFGSTTISEAYTEAVRAAGGLPVILPVGLTQPELENLFARLDGILLIGGGDIDPALFGGRPHPRVYGIEPGRDSMEIQMVRMAAERGKPFLGICRGVQVINVALGGTLFTDIADQATEPLRHDWYPDVPRDYFAHTVEVTAGSRLAAVLGGTEFPVNSLHHQGLEIVAPDLRVVARAPDGLVEAVELPGHPFGLGVQWHPEWLQASVPQRQVFRALVQAAQAQRS